MDSRTSCYIAEALADFCHSLLSRWLRRDAVQMRPKQSCAQTILCLIYARKKRKNWSREPERDRTWRLIWHKQNYLRETGTDLGLLSFNASAMRSKSYQNEEMYFRAPSCCSWEGKDHLSTLTFLWGDHGLVCKAFLWAQLSSV